MNMPILSKGSRRDGSQCWLSSYSSNPVIYERRLCMAASKNKTRRKHIRTEGTYTAKDIKSLTLDDGTRVVTSSDTDIKRPVCASIDVHKEILMAAVCLTDPETLGAVFYVRQFTSANSDIRRMSEWFTSYGVQDVCMESTGKYWIPVYDILEHQGLKPVLTHPKYVKQARGRKTDFRDAVHMASLFRMDLVVPSFIPPADIRDLRELCRYRLKLTYMRTSEKNRYQNSMTVSKIRLDSVFSDPFGKSASSIMSYLIETEPDQVSDRDILRLVNRCVKASGEDILESIHGYEFIGVQRDKLKIIQIHLDDLNKCISLIDEKLAYYRQKYAAVISHLVTMIGITADSALYVLGEIGTDMSVWRDSASLASWAGLSPANNESANKKKSTKIGNGGHYLKPLLVQCALAAVKSTKKDPYFYYKYQALKKRRGHKKAIIAIARKMLVAIYHMIRDDADFLPADYEETVTRNTKTDKGLNLTSIIEFLGEHGANAETLRLIKAQCSEGRKEEANNTGIQKTLGKEKQPISDTVHHPEQKPARKKNHSKSCQTEQNDSSGTSVPTATTA